MKDDEKYQELFNALLIKYGVEPDEEWTNIEWKIIIDSKLDTKQRELFYNELVNLDLNYKGWTHHRSTQEEIKEDTTKKVETEEEFKKCPYCAEDIKFAAIKCRHCHSDLRSSQTEETTHREETIQTFEPPPSYGFFSAVVTCFRKYFDFKGRASRSEWMYFSIFDYLWLFLLITIDYYNYFGYLPSFSQIFYTLFGMYELPDNKNLLFSIGVIITLVPSISVTARRFHDFNISGWWQLLLILIASLGSVYSLCAVIISFCICAIRGNNYKNSY